MHFAPAQWLIQLIALLPVALRPGVFLALVVALLWFVFVHRGLPSLWRRTCRGAAIAIDFSVGLALLPEYLFTSERRRRGEEPGSVTLAVAPLAEQILNAAAAVYQRNLPKKKADTTAAVGTSGKAAKATASDVSKVTSKRRFPWVSCGLVIVICAGAWIAMDQMAPADEAKRTFADAFEYWREVEAWAEVDPSQRAAPGDPTPPMVISVSYHRWLVRMAVRCPGDSTCVGTVNIRAGAGPALVSKSLELDAESSQVTTVELPHRPPQALQHLHVEVTQP
jgi:hypothetical protein